MREQIPTSFSTSSTKHVARLNDELRELTDRYPAFAATLTVTQVTVGNKPIPTEGQYWTLHERVIQKIVAAAQAAIVPAIEEVKAEMRAELAALGIALQTEYLNTCKAIGVDPFTGQPVEVPGA